MVTLWALMSTRVQASHGPALAASVFACFAAFCAHGQLLGTLRPAGYVERAVCYVSGRV